MSIFNRIVTSVSATVDRAVSRVENHDAVVEAALQDTRSAAARARVRLMRVKKDGEGLCRKLEELQRMELTWVERAKRVAKQDERKALECVQRRNQCRQQIAQTQEALIRHAELEQNITASVTHIEQRLEELTQQRNMLRSRDSAADAMRIISKLENNSATGLDETLDRWEMSISETEYMVGSSMQVDSLHDSFTQVENADVLRADLDTLMNEEISTSSEAAVEESGDE